MKPQNFTLTFTRDNCFIIQEVWNRGYAKDYFGNENPYKPTQIDHIVDGVCEIWDNENAIKWFEDNLLKKTTGDQEFFFHEMENYLPIAQKVKELSSKNRFDNISALKDFIALLQKGTYGFLLFYHSAKDERTSENIRKRALEIRDEDAFYDDADRIIKSTIEHFYPYTKGLSISIVLRELNNIPNEKELRQRFNHCMMIEDKLLYTDLESFITTHLQQYHFDFPKADPKGVLKGQTGFTGNAKGTVRILKRKNQVDELQEGEILVSPMTTPDFVPAMKKSSAIVTDEGGMLCHAAIVARELKIPCIIGTRVATQVLKDGMLVEVDANKGIVKILKRT